MAFELADAPVEIRPDLVDAYRRAWRRLAEPGTWWTGVERIAIAAETRAAPDCTLCAERKAALSPWTVDGAHACSSGDVLPVVAVDVVHRITTDASRLTKSGVEKLLASGLSPERYVEAVSVAVQVISIDAFHRALGLALEPLPDPEPGEPSRAPATAIVQGDAWVPWLDPGRATDPDERRLFPDTLQVPNVLRALSLVPTEVRGWRDLSDAQYLTPSDMMALRSDRALDRAQIELVAGRVSALNECFY